MDYEVDKIVGDVRVCLDENRTSSSFVNDSSAETLLLNDIIESKIKEAIDFVHVNAPYYKLTGDTKTLFRESGGRSVISVVWFGVDANDACGAVKIPDDFLRLVVFEMSDWERPVYTAIGVDDPEYAKQRGKIKGVRGNPERPVCALTSMSGSKTLEFYSCRNRQATVRQATYIPYAEISDSRKVFISKRCYSSMVYVCAGLTLSTYGDKEKSNDLFNTAKTLLQK